MTTKQELFVQKYLENGYNATRAYMDAYPGKDENTAAVNGHKLLRSTNIQDLIAKHKKELADKSEITKEYLIQQLKDILEDNKENNPKAALGAIEQITKMLGYNAPTEIQNTNIEQPLFTLIPIEEIKPKQLDGPQ